MTDYPRIWVLLGHRRGDNNQLLGLAEGLGLPFETRSLQYRNRWPLLLTLFPKRPFLLTQSSRRSLLAPWPDVVIGIGRRSVAVARWIKAKNGGRTKIVRLGNPRAEPGLFDLIITTPQYPVGRSGNVLTLPVSMGRHSKSAKPTDKEAAWLNALPRPHLLVSLGGTTRYWTLEEGRLSRSLERVAKRAEAAGGTLIVVTSPRTPPGAVEVVKAAQQVLADGHVRYPVLLADADENFVTADSVSMISEAVMTGKPVGLIPVELDEEGRRELGTEGFSDSKRDIRRVWQQLQLGTVDEPRQVLVPDPVTMAAKAVKALLSDRVE